MPHAATRLWTLPLTLLLVVNLGLVALAYRKLGAAAVPWAAAEAGPVIEPIEVATTPVDTATAGQTPAAGTADVEPVETVGTPENGESLAASQSKTASNRESNSNTNAEANLTIVIEPWGDEDAASPPPVMCVLPPVESVVTAADEPAEEIRDALVVVNPPTTRGAVHFVVDGVVVSLESGEMRRWPGQDERRIQFHRGDDFGDAEERCQVGVFAFVVTDDGWALQKIEPRAVGRLLKECDEVGAMRDEG